jgi:hypothetical protein
MAETLNSQGLTAQQMGELAQKQMEDRVKAEAMSNPNALVFGAQTGVTTSQNMQNVPVYYGVQQQVNPVVQQPTKNTYWEPGENRYIEGDVNVDRPWEKYGLGSANALYNTDPNTLKALKDRKNQTQTQASVPQTGLTVTSGTGDAQYASTEAGLMMRERDLEAEKAKRIQELRDAQKQEELGIRTIFNERRAQLGEQQAEERATRDVLSYRLGRKDTPYGASEMSQLARTQERTMNDLATQESQLVMQSMAALRAGEFDVAERIGQEADRILDRRIKQEQLATQKRNQILAEKKYVQDFGKDVLSQMAMGGVEPSEELFNWYDSAIGVQGVGKSLYQVSVQERERQKIEDEQEAWKLDVDMADKIVGTLNKLPAGESITIGGNTYMGMSRGNLKTGTETDAQGNVTFWQFDEQTQKVSKTALGNIGKPQDGWTTVQTDQGMFSYNTKTKVAVPLEPDVAQSTWQEFFPEGEKPPFRSEDDPMNGMCGAFWNDLFGERIIGDSLEQKKATLSQFEEVPRGEVQVGDTFLEKSGTTGHIGVVASVKQFEGKTILTFLESNAKPPGGQTMSTTRTVPADSANLLGFYRVPLKNLPAAGTDSGVTIGGRPISQVLGGQEADTDAKLLSVDDAKSLGLPYGTTVGQARGKGITPGTKPTSTTTVNLPKPPSFEDFAKEYESQYTQEIDGTKISPPSSEVKNAYEQEKAYAQQVSDTFNAIKRGLYKNNTERAEYTQQAIEAINNGDDEGLVRIATQVALNKLTAKKRGNYETSLNLVESYESAIPLVQSLDQDGIFKGAGSIKGFIEKTKKKAGVNADPRVLQLEQILGTFQNEARNAIFGASLTPQELAESNKVFARADLATPKDLLVLLEQGRQIQQFAADVTIASSLGLKRPKLSDYLNQK